MTQPNLSVKQKQTLMDMENRLFAKAEGGLGKGWSGRLELAGINY